VTLAFGVVIGLGSSASACSACFGKSDSALAAGMNWGIFTLLGVIGSVLGGVASFFVYLAKKSAAINAASTAAAGASVTIAELEPERAEDRERELAGTLD